MNRAEYKAEQHKAVRHLFYSKHLEQWFGRKHMFEDILNWMYPHTGAVQFLEIGIYSGEIAEWIDENPHIDAMVQHYIGVDITLSRVAAIDEFPKDKFMFAEMPSTDWWDELPSTEKWDFIFVDGDHGYLPTVTDIQEAKKHVSDYGFILVHDIEYQPEMNEELQPDHAFDMCIDSSDDFRYIRLPFHNEGMGLIFKR